MQTWRLKPAVQALMAFRGFQLVAAMITDSELGDIHRFAHPRQLMTYLGLLSLAIALVAVTALAPPAPAQQLLPSRHCRRSRPNP